MTIAGLRVLMTTDAVGGVWTYTLDLAAGLAAAGAVVRIAVLGPPLRPDQRDELARRGVDAEETHLPLEWLAVDPTAVQGAAQAIASRARAWRADLVHLHSTAYAAAAFDCPVVATIHSCVATWWAAVRSGPLPEDFRWRAELVGSGLRHADLVLAPTAAFAATVASRYNLAHAPLAVHNGRPGPVSVADELEQEEVLAVGRLWDDGKNIAALDRAAALLPWPVRAAGEVDGPDGTQIDLSHVEPLGRQSEVAVRGLLGRRPIFVAPARYEPFGLAVLEAAQAGCALVLNDIATFRELWDGAAVFTNADDPAALAGALRMLLEDRTRRRALGRAAHDRARRYALESMAAGTLAAYARCLHETARPALVGA